MASPYTSRGAIEKTRPAAKLGPRGLGQKPSQSLPRTPGASGPGGLGSKPTQTQTPRTPASKALPAGMANRTANTGKALPRGIVKTRGTGGTPQPQPRAGGIKTPKATPQPRAAKTKALQSTRGFEPGVVNTRANDVKAGMGHRRRRARINNHRG